MPGPVSRTAAALVCTAVLLAPAPVLATKTLVTLLTFDGYDGSNPGRVVADAKGNLFGTTHYGGNGEYGPGTVYEMSYTKAGGWALSTLYDFTDADDGGYPDSNPVIGKGGTLYGAALGGSNGKAPGGLVYALEPQSGSWTFETLYDFQGTNDGNVELYSPLLTRNGKVYGVTPDGGSGTKCGSHGCGTLFKLEPPSGGGSPWHHRVLFSFSGGSSGSVPTSLVSSGSAGGVYVATDGGNGAVVSLAPGAPGQGWTETVLYSFAGGNDGEGPGSLVVAADGTIYGVAGGGSNGAGIAFSLAQSNGTWIKTTLYNFSGDYGPSSLTLAPQGGLIGTVFGDIDLYFGNVFQLSPPKLPGRSWKYRLLYDFNSQGGPSINPNNVVFGKGGHLYGTLEGGDSNDGAVFELH